ncbi:MAG: rhodanese-like domain-containing protein [bacterium]|nr:rhodanese-like domain-containing protein [bacterium]
MKFVNKQTGVIIALILGALMLLLPTQDKTKYSFEPSLLAKAISNNEDQVSPVELSDWIIKGKNDYQLIDIRSEKEYGNGSIKGAENIPLEKLLKKETINDELSDSKIIVLYSTGNSHAHQAWLVLKSVGKDAYVLEGGYNFWNSMILNPKLPSREASDDEILKYKKAKYIAAFFGGSSAQVESADGATPQAKKPVKRKKKKKKLEGC